MVSEWMRRKSTRLDRLHEQQLNTYVDTLQATARFADNAREWSAIPLADLQEADDEELNRLVSRLRVVGSKKVYKQFSELTRQLHLFNRALSHAQDHHSSLRESSVVDNQTSIQQRMALADIADQIVGQHKKIERIVRDEMRR